MEIEIKNAMTGLRDRLSGLGYVTPDAWFSIGFLGENCCIKIGRRSSAAFGSPETNHYAHGESFAECLEKANEHIDALPPVGDVRRKEFTVALANLIEMGREIGIEDGLVNPLSDMMRKLSTNIIEAKGETA